MYSGSYSLKVLQVLTGGTVYTVQCQVLSGGTVYSARYSLEVLFSCPSSWEDWVGERVGWVS